MLRDLLTIYISNLRNSSRLIAIVGSLAFTCGLPTVTAAVRFYSQTPDSDVSKICIFFLGGPVRWLLV